MAYTEFYCNASTGSNINAGDNAQAAVTSVASGTYTQGAGAGGTDRYVAASGTPFSGVSVGHFVSIYTDAATLTTFIGRVTAVNSSSSIDISLTAIAGTRPTNGSTYTATVGGKWKGPNAAQNFPFNFITNVLINSTGNPYRVNLENTASYTVTAVVTHSLAGPGYFQGCTSSPGDLGKFTIDGTTSVIIIAAISGADIQLVDCIALSSATSGTNVGVNVTGTETVMRRCVVTGIRSTGLVLAGTGSLAIECEAYACNKSNTANAAGISVSGNGAMAKRCISHDNTAGANAHGFITSSANASSNRFDGCISDSNTGYGFLLQMRDAMSVTNCDAYNNTLDGIRIASNAGACGVYIENCNLVKNGGYGINPTDTSLVLIVNCGFGTGTQINTSGTVASNVTAQEEGSVNYANDVTPWVDPANGDFRINLAAAKGAGRGAFTQTAASYAGTVAYPDIGAAQHVDTPPQYRSRGSPVMKM